jgi:hypothetical protein
MGYAIPYTQGKIIERNNLKKTGIHTTTFPKGVDNFY